MERVFYIDDGGGDTLTNCFGRPIKEGEIDRRGEKFVLFGGIVLINTDNARLKTPKIQ
jgi:hypothetical protein